MTTGNASAQNNVVTAAEYQQAADEITEIINVQRAERAPLEAQLDQLQVRAETQQQRQTTAFANLREAELTGDPNAIAAARFAFRRAQNDVVVTGQAQQQIRSSLAQSRQSTAELQEQRGSLEVKAEFAASGPPTQNSEPPPATVIPDQAATYVPPPQQPIPVEVSPPLLTDAELAAIYPATDPQEVGALRGTTIITDEARRIMSDPAVIAQQRALDATSVSPVPPTVTARELSADEANALLDQAENPPAQNNVSTANEWQVTENQIAAASRSVRAENAAAAENLVGLRSQYNQVTQADETLRGQIAIAQRSGASAAEIERLEERRGETLARSAELERQIVRDESVIAQNQETLAQLDQQRFIAEEAQFAARSGPPGLNSVPGPATAQPDLDPAAYDLPPQTYSQNFQADSVSADGDEALAAYDQALLAQQEGRAFAQPEISASGDEALQAYEEALLAQQEGRAFESRAPAVAADGDEALAAFEQAQLAQNEAAAFGATNVNDPYYGLSPQQIAALGGADPTDPYIRARLGIPQLPGSELVATPGFGTIKTGVPLIDNALSFLGGLFGRPAAPPTPAAAEVTAASDAELQAIQDAEAQQLAEQEGRAFPPVENAPDISASGDEALQAIEDAEAAALGLQEGSAFAEPAPVNTLDDPEARAIQDAIDTELAEQEGRAFPPIEDAAPVTGDEAITAFEDAQAAELAAAEGSAFAAPAPVDPELDEQLAQSTQNIEDTAAADLAAQEGLAFAPPVAADGDEALQAFEDAQAADLAAQEGLAFPPIDSPAPVAGDEALQAIEDAEAADLARQEGIAFAEPLDVPASGDEALQAIEDAELAAQEGSAFAESPLPVSGDEALEAANEAELAAIREAEGRAILGPAPVDGDPAYGGASDAEAAAINQAQADDAESFGAAGAQAGRENQLREQFTIQQRHNTSTQGDWRVRIRLAPGANCLYKAPAGQRGILEPLVASDGVIFPYTPTIQTSYQAKYDSYNLTHSNYRGYFYQSSQVGDISISGIFTAQDTAEANYMLAVIHFFRSVTKMFYGKDQFRGAPPPMVELSGFGQYQFNNHPCLVASFNYSLPKDVDYIQIAPNNQGLNLGNRPSKVSSSPSSTLESVTRRLATAGLPRGGQTTPTDLGVVTGTVNGTTQTTYVPTKIEIAITLHPLQTRQQVSQAFSLENFANGNLLKGGFW